MDAQVTSPSGTDSPSPRRRSRRAARRRRNIAIGICVAVLAAATGLTLWRQDRLLERYEQAARNAERVEADQVRLAAIGETRPVYRYSVVPGGVFTPAELERAMKADPVVAAHYAAVDLRKLRVEYLREQMAAHVSYRIADDVYWTRKKLELKAGERVLTDGNIIIRARCGNNVSVAALPPALDTEPAPEEFDWLGDPTVLAALPEPEPAPAPALDAPASAAVIPPGGRRPYTPGGGFAVPVPRGQTEDPKRDPDPDPTPDPDPEPDPDPDDPGDDPLPVPEPTTLVLVGIGAATGLARHLRKRRAAQPPL